MATVKTFKTDTTKRWKISDVVDGWRLKVQLDSVASSNRGDDALMRSAALDLLKRALFRGRMIAKERLEAGFGGLDCAELLAAVQDEVLIALFEFTTKHVFRVHNRTTAESLAICATGGYGRFALAPSSDVDLLFIRPAKDAAWAESVIEYTLYMLWDMGLKIGHASRTINECMRAAKEDFTIRTAVLETRFICGDKKLYDALESRLFNELFKNTGAEFVAAKLKERDTRHSRAGESRYMVEPNIKDGKGGLRDLHTLFWIAKYLHNIKEPEDYIKKNIFTPEQMRTFMQAAEFLWSVRCHLHFLTGRPEERITFDLQPEMARLMGYGDRADNPAVERFMKKYFITAKEVGALTRIMSAKLEADFIKQEPKGISKIFGALQRPRTLEDKRFVAFKGRIGFKNTQIAQTDKLAMLSIFHLANKLNLDIDPTSLAQISRLAPKDVALGNNKEAKEIFLEIMAAENGPAAALNLMNECGLLGRMVPEFARIVGQTQFNMYHHFTVDEHTLRAVAILGDIEQGKCEEDLPLATSIFPKILNRRALYLAMLLHDVGKGEGDQQILGAKAAKSACKRLGVDPHETELVAWLVGHHLVMSDVAQKRDLGDPLTIAKFAETVESLEKLRLLLALTVADIRAVGPGVWNDWKAQLLRDLYKITEAVLRGGRADEALVQSVLNTQAEKTKTEFLKDGVLTEWFSLIDNAYWLSFAQDQHLWHQTEIRKAIEAEAQNYIAARIVKNRAATEIIVLAPDRPGLFAAIAEVFANHNSSVLDARIYTSRTGQAFDVFAIQNSRGEAFGSDQESILNKLKEDLLNCTLQKASSSKAQKSQSTRRQAAFEVEPFVLIDNNSSNTDTIIEVSGLDRPGLLAELAQTLIDEALNITSAHIGGIGERAQDAFYVRTIAGLKLEESHRQERLKNALYDVLKSFELDAPTIVSKRTLARARASTRR